MIGRPYQNAPRPFLQARHPGAWPPRAARKHRILFRKELSMTLSHAVAGLVLCLAQPGGGPPIDLAEGVHGLTGRVAKVIGQDLILIVEQGREEKRLRLKTAGDSRFSLVD